VLRRVTTLMVLLRTMHMALPHTMPIVQVVMRLLLLTTRHRHMRLHLLLMAQRLLTKKLHLRVVTNFHILKCRKTM
jgi:hypothetical protein